MCYPYPRKYITHNKRTGQHFSRVDNLLFFLHNENISKAIGNWHNESPIYNEYMLIKMGKKL
jgi:hypothetical protein